MKKGTGSTPPYLPADLVNERKLNGDFILKMSGIYNLSFMRIPLSGADEHGQR